MQQQLHFYHTNDIHSALTDWPKIVTILKEQRTIHQAANEDVFVFDIGDFVDRSNIIAEALLGKGNVDLLNHAGYDAVTIGNNEGITLTKETLQSLYENATFPVLVANVFNQDLSSSTLFQPYKIFEGQNGLKVAVIGLTAPFKLFYELLGMRVDNPQDILDEIMPELEQSADVIVLLSHLGLDEDYVIAEKYPKIDVILGGHTHQLLERGETKNGVLIGQCGKHGDYVGHVTLSIDSESKIIKQKQAEVLKVNSHVEDEETIRLLNNLKEESEQLLSEPVAHLEQEISLDWFAESQFPNIAAEALREWCDSEVAMVNAGVLLEPLKCGVVTRQALHRLCPHPINPCKIQLTGEELKEVITESVTEKMEQLKVRGLGFRGKVMGKMAFSGIEVKTKVLADGKKHVHDIIVLGEPLNLKRNYQIGTIDMFTFGRLFPAIRNTKEKQYFMPELLRDVLLWKLKR